MFGNQIAGKISCEGKRIFYSFNPSLNQQNTSAFPIATNEEVEHALAISKTHFIHLVHQNQAIVQNYLS